MELRFSVSINGDFFDASGDAAFMVKMLPLFARWFDSLDFMQQRRIDALTLRLKRSNDRLDATVHQATSPPAA